MTTKGQTTTTATATQCNVILMFLELPSADVFGITINDMTRTRIVLLVLVLIESGLAALTMTSTAITSDSVDTRTVHADGHSDKCPLV